MPAVSQSQIARVGIVVSGARSCLVVDRADHGASEAVAGNSHQLVVELRVQHEVPWRQVDRCLELADERGQPLDAVVVRSPRRASRHLCLERRPDGDQAVDHLAPLVVAHGGGQHDRVEQVPVPVMRHNAPMPLPDADETLLLERLQCLSYDRPADSEVQTQRRSGREQSPGGIATGDDLVDQRVDDADAQAGRSLGQRCDRHARGVAYLRGLCGVVASRGGHAPEPTKEGLRIPSVDILQTYDV